VRRGKPTKCGECFSLRLNGDLPFSDYRAFADCLATEIFEVPLPREFLFTIAAAAAVIQWDCRRTDVDLSMITSDTLC
jgi:hypothetical protein